MDIDDLERRAGALTPDDVAAAEAALHAGALAPADTRRLVGALARQRDEAVRGALVHLLRSSQDAALVRAALEVLCVQWDDAARHLDAVAHFVRGAAWDIAAGGEVRRAAIAVAGGYLARHEHTPLLFELIAISEGEEDEATRLAAVRALAQATGYRGRPVDLQIDL
ncbi:MAG TPA: hypothetical protein VFC53_03295 [Dehalococcoidia bacterium]|nr:hypothetical protein [Dehalococcoidia bacterium]